MSDPVATPTDPSADPPAAPADPLAAPADPPAAQTGSPPESHRARQVLTWIALVLLIASVIVIVIEAVRDNDASAPVDDSGALGSISFDEPRRDNVGA